MLRTRTANNLANTLSTRFRKYAKALLLLEAVLEVHRRVLQAPHSERFAPLVHWRGSVTEAYSGLEFHPGGLGTRISPEKLVSDAAGDRAVANCVVSIPPPRAAIRLAERCDRCPPALAAGTAARRRVVAKPEHNIKRARRAVFRHTAAGCSTTGTSFRLNPSAWLVRGALWRVASWRRRRVACRCQAVRYFWREC